MHDVSLYWSSKDGGFNLNYFKNTPIRNPLNIKRILGDLPTSSSSGKNVGIIMVSFTLIAITFSRFWNFLLGIFNNAIVSAIVMVLVYAIIIFRVLALTVFEERKHKKAFLDFMDNKTSDISIIWELQDIKEYTTERGTKFAYLDYIDGTRSVYLRCIYGSVINRDEDAEEAHVDIVTNVMSSISSMGFKWEPDSKPIRVNDDKILNMYYKTIKEFDDLDFIQTFTQILDTIDYLANNVSAVYAVHFKISATGRYRHGMFEKLENIPNAFGTQSSFDYIDFISNRHELDKYLADELGVGLFDREELIMMKYRDQASVGDTAVIYAYDDDDNLLKQFNKELNIERKVTVQSFDLINEAKSKSLKELSKATPQETLALQIATKGVTIEEAHEAIDIVTTPTDSEFLRLLYDKDEVKLG